MYRRNEEKKEEGSVVGRTERERRESRKENEIDILSVQG